MSLPCKRKLEDDQSSACFDQQEEDQRTSRKPFCTTSNAQMNVNVPCGLKPDVVSGEEFYTIDKHNVDSVQIQSKKREKRPQHHESCCHYPEQCMKYGPPSLIPTNQLYKLLYINPVSLLTSLRSQQNATVTEIDPHYDPARTPNVMTITWLTPTDNNGNFFCSMNATRFSLKNVLDSRRFVLNIPVAGMETLIKDIGKCSGSSYFVDEQVDGQVEKSQQDIAVGDGSNAPGEDNQTNTPSFMSKFDLLNIPMTSLGWKKFNPIDSDIALHSDAILKRSFPQSQKLTPAQDLIVQEMKNELLKSLGFGDIILPDCVAHVVCEIVGYIPPIEENSNSFPVQDSGNTNLVGTPQHYSFFAKTKIGFVRRKYWNQGLFQPVDAPPLLTFLGQGQFLHCKKP
jgi:hypothetical protein